MRKLLIASIALGFLPARAASQAPRALPLVSADFMIGATQHPDRVGSTWFTDTQEPATRIALAVRLGSKGRIRPVAMIDYSGPPFQLGHNLLCVPAPDGQSCRATPHSYSGRSVGLGVRALVGGYLTAGVGAGTAFYDRRGTYLEAELVGQPGRHVGFVLSFRHVELHHAGIGRMWLRPMTVGLRIQ